MGRLSIYQLQVPSKEMFCLPCQWPQSIWPWWQDPTSFSWHHMFHVVHLQLIIIHGRELQDDEDKDFLLDGINSRVSDCGSILYAWSSWVWKLQIVTGAKNRENVEKQIVEEIAEGCYVVVRERPDISSRLGSVPKSNSEKMSQSWQFKTNNEKSEFLCEYQQL